VFYQAANDGCCSSCSLKYGSECKPAAASDDQLRLSGSFLLLLLLLFLNACSICYCCHCNR
jgi:hypothetical protein